MNSTKEALSLSAKNLYRAADECRGFESSQEYSEWICFESGVLAIERVMKFLIENGLDKPDWRRVIIDDFWLYYVTSNGSWSLRVKISNHAVMVEPFLLEYEAVAITKRTFYKVSSDKDMFELVEKIKTELARYEAHHRS